VFRGVLQRYYEAYVRKDLDAMAAVWHPSGPARARRNVVRLEFDTRDVALAGLTVENASADAGGGRARAIIDLAVTNTKTKAARRERRVRDFTFMPDDAGQWRIWNEASLSLQLARRLLSAPAGDRESLLAADPELASDDTLDGLTVEAGRLQGLGQQADVLGILAVQGWLARALGNQEVLGTSLIRTGSLHMLMGRQAEAADAFTAARQAFTAAGLRDEIAACDANLANLAYMQGRFAEAADRYQLALEVFERMNDDGRMASVLHGLGNALYMQTEFARALEQYRRAMTVLERTEDKRGLAAVHQAIALVYKEQGEYALAAESWRLSLGLHESLKDLAGAAKAWSGLGEIERLQGDLGSALDHHVKSLQLWEQVKNVGSRASESYAIGQIYALQRSFPRALEFYAKALELDRSIRDDPRTSDAGQARDLGGMGGAHFAQSQPELALDEYQKSLAIREKVKDEGGIIWTHVHIGIVHASQGRYQEALASYQRALDLAEPAREQAAVGAALALGAAAHLLQGNSEPALASATRATDLAASIERFDTVAFARVVAGKVHQKAGRFDEARAAFEDAVAAIRKVPVGLAADTFFDDRRAPYVALVELCLAQNATSEAFLWSERGRLRALADMLGGDGVVVVKGMTDAERDEERRIGRDLKTAAVKARRERGRQKPDADRLASLQAEAGRLQADRDTLRKRVFEAHPALRAQRAQSEPVGADAAGTILSVPGTALLSYVVGEQRCSVFAVARQPSTGAWAVQQAATIEVKAADLAQLVRQYREAIAARGEETTKLSEELYARLLAPVQATLSGKTKVVILPDSALWSLPFEALRTPSGRYLIEDAAVSYAPSLTAFGAIGAIVPDPATRRSLVAFANPALGPAVADRLALLRAGAASSAPGADPDVARVAPLFGPTSRVTFAGEQARPERLAQGVAAGAVLHLGVPVLLSEASPLYSLIVLAPADAADAGTGLVEVAALMGVNLPASVAVVPRLEYGPSAGTGEAITALTWSLVIGGTPTTVANRWVAGEKDPSVVTRFYRNFVAPAAAGRRPGTAESLRKAMVGLIAEPATNHPFFWAGLMVIGR
jgi:tetratricopeptide (TPR) repeat protein/CHAT domain-containing protein